MEADASMTDGHLCNMGRMIEEMESKMRNGLDQVNFCILRMDLEGAALFRAVSFIQLDRKPREVWNSIISFSTFY
jgi:hypothetical protein